MVSRFDELARQQGLWSLEEAPKAEFDPRRRPPMRKIVLLRDETLSTGFETRDFASAQRLLDYRLSVRGMRYLDLQYAVRIPMFGPIEPAPLYGSPTNYEGDQGHAYVVVAEFDDEEAEQRLLRHVGDQVQGIYVDPKIAPFTVVCPASTSAVGTSVDVQSQLNLTSLTSNGFTGRGIKIVVVDTGIDGSRINVSGGYNPRPGVAPGTSPPDHGTMVAFDALLSAPNAMVYDYALLQSLGGQWVAFLSDAIRAFAEIMVDHLKVPGPMVVVNSWGMYDRSGDAPPGNPQNYSANSLHPFNQITGALVRSGVDVVFAAGNCGSTCPSRMCGGGDRGPGNSIHGANSHPEVITVGAVTVKDDVLGYSSEGPGGLCQEKPDIAAFSHFSGSGVFAVDSGTSAACPIVAGVAAALRSKPSAKNLSPAQFKRKLLETARTIGAPGWKNAQTGWGIVDAGAAEAAM